MKVVWIVPQRDKPLNVRRRNFQESDKTQHKNVTHSNIYQQSS